MPGASNQKKLSVSVSSRDPNQATEATRPRSARADAAHASLSHHKLVKERPNRTQGPPRMKTPRTGPAKPGVSTPKSACPPWRTVLPTAPRRGPSQRWRAFSAPRSPCQLRSKHPPDPPPKRQSRGPDQSPHPQETETRTHPASARSSPSNLKKKRHHRNPLKSGAARRR